VRSRDAIDALNNELVRRLQAGELDHIWMAPPDIIDWADTKGFRYLRKRSPLFPDLDVAAAQQLTRLFDYLPYLSAQ
jgi:uncharacterized protein (TIGR04141 family)